MKTFFFYSLPNVKKYRGKERTFRKKEWTFFLEFCFTAEFSQLFDHKFWVQKHFFPKICAQKVIKLFSKKKHEIQKQKKKSALFFNIFLTFGGE
jgi:hypothetical protein